jgi:hypothetical protein
LRVLAAVATLPIPTTKVLIPAAAAIATAISAATSSFGLSVIVHRLLAVAMDAQPTGQLGRPSVASRRYLGFESVRLCRYIVP